MIGACVVSACEDAAPADLCLRWDALRNACRYSVPDVEESRINGLRTKGNMRIISGLARGIRLEAPEGRSLRPTEDRVKESMFSTLGDVQGRIVADLYSGTGALGLEALSRGAAKVFFFEKDRRHVEYIKKNLASVAKSIGGECGEARVFCSDAKKAPEMLPGAEPEIVLADPPYGAGVNEYGAAGLLLDDRMASWVSEGCILVLEHASDNVLPWDEQCRWRLLKTKVYGIRAVSFAVRSADNDKG